MKIGIVSPWFERGAAYVSLMMHQALRQEHELHVFAIAGKPPPVGEEWKVPNLTWARPSAEVISAWAQKRKLDILILCERQDVFPKRDFKALTLLMWEWVKPSQVPSLNAHFDGVIAPTLAAFRRFQDLGIERIFYVPWGANLDIFHPEVGQATLQFFHPAGFGGVAGRRGTRIVKAAFKTAKTGEAQLLITAQRARQRTILHDGSITTMRGTLPQAVLAKHYRESDVALLPSRWEGLGLTFLEALASGLAIVTADAAPMNEYVEDGVNGFLCPAHLGGMPSGIQIPQARINGADFVEKIEVLCQDPKLAREMGYRSRERAKANFDWAKNGKVLIRIIEQVCDET